MQNDMVDAKCIGNFNLKFQKRTFGSIRRRWEGNLVIDLKEISLSC
jgi:hypothetical protein